MRNLPFQFGRTYRINCHTTAHTRTIFSRRMQAQSQRYLDEAVTIARDSLAYSIIQTGNLISSFNSMNQLPPYSYDQTFNNVFISWFHVDASSVDEYCQILSVFRHICFTILCRFITPLRIVDTPIREQQQNHRLGYVNYYRLADTNPRGNIHINFSEIQPGNEWHITEILLHEASHKFAHSADHHYNFQLELTTCLSAPAMLNNADTIARFIAGAYQHKLH